MKLIGEEFFERLDRTVCVKTYRGRKLGRNRYRFRVLVEIVRGEGLDQAEYDALSKEIVAEMVSRGADVVGWQGK